MLDKGSAKHYLQIAFAERVCDKLLLWKELHCDFINNFVPLPDLFVMCTLSNGKQPLN